MKTSNHMDLTQGNILGNLMKLALPIMLSNFFQTFYNLTDAFWLGKLGDQARAAVSVAGMTFPIVFFLSSFGFGFVVAGTSLIAQYKGAGTIDKAKEVVGQFILILLAFCVLFIFISIFYIDEILHLLQTPPEIFQYAKSYISIILSGMIFMFVFLSYQSFSHGLGDTVSPMKIQLISVGLNVVLDPLLIFGIGFFPKLGIVGAAYATISARIVGAVLAIYFMRKKSPILIPHLSHLVPDKTMLWRILKISIPASFAQSMTSLGFVLLQGFVNTFGTVIISINSIGNRLTGFFMMPAMGISNALGAIVGQNIGANNVNRAIKTVNVAFTAVFGIMLVGCSMIYLFGAEMTKFFINDPEVIAVGARMMKITSIASLLFSVGFVFMGVFNGSGHTKYSMIFNLTRLWLLRIPLVYILSGRLIQVSLPFLAGFEKILSTLANPLSEHPYEALWWSMIISNSLAGVAAYFFYRMGKWQQSKIS